MSTAFRPQALDCASAEAVFRAGDAGPIWQLTAGLVRLDRDDRPECQPVQIAMPGELLGAEVRCDLQYRFSAKALTACRLESVEITNRATRDRLLRQALLQQQRRAQDMAVLRKSSVLQRITHLIHLLGFVWTKPNSPCHAEAIRSALPALREIAQLIDAKTETVGRVLGKLLPPRRRLNAMVNLGSAVALANQLGFRGRFHVQLPRGEDGVFTLSADSMSGDLTDPTGDRTVHVDRFTGHVLAEAAFEDYSTGAKVMAVGTALHQGDLGVWNALLNMLLCAAVAFLSVSGVVMWWKRRPAGSGRLFAPGMPQNPMRWKTGALVMLGVARVFPLAGAALLGFLLLDALLLSRVPALRRMLS